MMFAVGEKYPEFATGVDFVRMDYEGMVLRFIYAMNDPSPTEKKMVEEDNLSVAYTVLEDIPFFLLSFDSLGGWMDTPFYPNPYPAEYFQKTFEVKEGLPLIVHLVDSLTGELVHMRVISLSNAMSNNLFEDCRQLQKLPQQTPQEHTQKIDKVYRKYPSGDSMLSTVKPDCITQIIVK